MPELQHPASSDHHSPDTYRHHSGPLLDMRVAGPDRYFYLRTYAAILFRHRWTILTTAFVVTTLAAIVTFNQKTLYEATARVEVEADVPAIQSLNEFDQGIPSDEIFLETQVKILESDNLAWQTVQQLGLAQQPEFSRRRPAQESGSGQTRALFQSQMVAAFREGLQVKVARGSRVLEIGFRSPDPQLSARVANALVNNYVEYSFRKKYDATRQASGWMEQQLDELKAKVEKSQQALLDYERRNALVSIGDKQNMAEQKLADLNRELTTAQAERLQKQAVHEMVAASDSQVALVAQNTLLERLEEKQANLKTEYVDALNQYGPNFPKVVRLREQANEVQALIERERKRVVARIRNEYTAALGREKLLTAAIGLQKEEVARLNQLLIEHNLLKREFETNQQLYENLLHRLKDATLSAGLRAANVHLVDPAFPPASPVSPKKLRTIVLGLLLGLFAGLGLALLRESLDTSIQSPDEMERLGGLPTLAVIPAAKTASAQPRLPSRRAPGTASEDGAVALAVLRAPSSALAEAYRALRTAVLLATSPRPPQALLVTSAQPGEGKSCTALNLALTLSQQGCRVLLMDSDLRRSGIDRKLGLEGRTERGLSSCLAGAHSLEEVLCSIDEIPNLWVLPAGPRPSQPAELLSSRSMQDVMQALRGRFDHLVLDSPPVLLVTDATILSTLVDGVVMVVESRVTRRSALDRARRILEASGGRILGTVLNKVDVRQDGYYGLKLQRYYRFYFR